MSTEAASAEALAALPAMAELVPHDPPMLLVDAITAWTPTTATVVTKIRAGSPFVVDGRVPASFGLEYMAQAVAAAKGAARHLGAGEASTDAQPPIGMLLGSRELRLMVESFAVGDALEIHVEREYDDGTLARYVCELRRDRGEAAEAGELLAGASLTVMIVDESSTDEPDGEVG